MDIASNVATSRLVAQQRAMDVMADNIANANTPGFKAQRMQFSDWLSPQKSAAPQGGGTIAYTQDRATWREQQVGTLSHTGNPLDLALGRDGYFTVQTANGSRLTRDGRFGLLANGTLANSAGDAVLDSNGQRIQFAPTDTQITIAGDGTVSTENGQLAKVGVVNPTEPMQLAAEGNTLFRADTTTTTPVTAPAIVQGSIEDSNVQPVLETTRMMDGERQFQFMMQFIQAESERQQSVIDKLLSPQV
jgi:flagellar basal-body rod protein FlgF